MPRIFTPKFSSDFDPGLVIRYLSTGCALNSGPGIPTALSMSSTCRSIGSFSATFSVWFSTTYQLPSLADTPRRMSVASSDVRGSTKHRTALQWISSSSQPRATRPRKFRNKFDGQDMLATLNPTRLRRKYDTII